ncbi:MAG: hypothetical protein ACRCYX_10130 [Dermatophilaceae bacterium]
MLLAPSLFVATETGRPLEVLPDSAAIPVMTFTELRLGIVMTREGRMNQRPVVREATHEHLDDLEERNWADQIARDWGAQVDRRARPMTCGTSWRCLRAPGWREQPRSPARRAADVPFGLRRS